MMSRGTSSTSILRAPRPNAGVTLVLIMLFASMSPFFASADEPEEEAELFTGSLADFDIDDSGKAYLSTPAGDPVFSGTRHLKNQWIAAGMPGMVLPFAPDVVQSRSIGARACENAWSQGDAVTMPTANGNIAAEVERVTSYAAIIVENGVSIPSTTINDIASTWDSSIYPTDTSYFGNPPDLDNNCQIEIVILDIDGPSNIGGYFSPGIASLREAIFVDSSDLGWRNVIFAHEFEHLLHNARDPLEYAWIDEGNADMAAFLILGAESTLIGHSNGWASNASCSVRWWNQRTDCDYGAGFLFMLYLADKLGGGQAIQSLVADTSTGGASIENLARNPVPGSPGNIGTTMDEIFANFTAAAVLDSQQGRFGFNNIEMGGTCSNSAFCRLQLTDQNFNWGSTYTSQNHDLEGWGVRAWRFASGTGAPLNVMVSPSEFGFDGILLQKDAVAQTWSTSDLRFDPGSGIGTGVVEGFGNITDEVYLITWYASTIDDCDYTFPNCGFSGGSTAYPTATVDVTAALISEPPTVRVESTISSDRDMDGDSDTVNLTMVANSTAFFEILDMTVHAFKDNILFDSYEMDVAAGNGVEVPVNLLFTAPEDGDYVFDIELRNYAGTLVDEALTAPIPLHNMAPVAASTSAANVTQTHLALQFFGAGYDEWGFSPDNQSFTQNETPVGYYWDFGDGSVSGLKNPLHAWVQPGNYSVESAVVDRGGGVSLPVAWGINVSDTSAPIVGLTVQSVDIKDGLSLRTNERVLFDARSTVDNVPDDQLFFTWDFGDGAVVSGTGLVEVDHAWSTGSSEGLVHVLNLTVSDGIFSSSLEVNITILNRPPRQIFDNPLETHTLTSLQMPPVFIDDDGTIVNMTWSFDEPVNLEGGLLSQLDPFTETESTLISPAPAWRTPGLKTINVSATDNDGNTTVVSLSVNVLNQRPIALFARPSEGTVSSQYTFQSTSFDPDGDDSMMTTIWNIEGEDEVINQSAVLHTFDEPGVYTVSLLIIDELGLESHLKSYLVSIVNPLPLPMLTAYEASIDGVLVTSPSEDISQFDFWHPLASDGGIFISTGTPIRFSAEGSRDADPKFAGMNDPNPSSPNWNGIVSYSWNFGDASPIIDGENVWHSFSLPGTYVVILTVRDGFGTGDTNQTQRVVHVSAPPTIQDTPLFNDEIEPMTNVILYVTYQDEDLRNGITAFRDTDVLSDSDADGVLDNDPNQPLNDGLTLYWDLDPTIDSNEDGDFQNDWIEASEITGLSWNESGTYIVIARVCDGTASCTIKAFSIDVRDDTEVGPRSLSDFELSDLIPSDSSSLWVLLLVALVLVLGWLVMRQPNEEEAEVDEQPTYDVTEIQTEGGMIGMDQHSAPPKPKNLDREDRRSRESGYVRPVGSRRR
ncbi:MAG: PKD domain-containing protein [Candidatus Poseidoniales archaeon]|nr:MAG: PKD domain-containing protein [Candidatus Poseidoniales archaeon]